MENAASGAESVYSLSNTTKIHTGKAMAVTFLCPSKGIEQYYFMLPS